MNDLQERITKRTGAEVRYLRGYQRMNLERFRYYQSVFQEACDQSDFRKMHDVIQDTVTITNDTIRLIRKRMAITARRSFSFAVDETIQAPKDNQSPPPPYCAIGNNAASSVHYPAVSGQAGLFTHEHAYKRSQNPP